jgi:hypothetical protein
MMLKDGARQKRSFDEVNVKGKTSHLLPKAKDELASNFAD